MSLINNPSERILDSDLVRMIEPLVSYICATEQPRSALLSAVAVLFSEVRETNQTAQLHAGHFAASCRA